MFVPLFHFRLLIFLLSIFCWLDVALSKTFIHMTDLSYDSLYRDGSSSTVKCHYEQLGANKDCGLFGAPGSSSYSSDLLISQLMLQIIHKLECPDFILYSGGSVRHSSGMTDDFKSSSDWAAEMILAMKKMRTPFEACPKVKIIYAVGNTDTFPERQLSVGEPNAILSNLTSIWDIPSTQILNFNKFGSYYTKINTTLYVISVNTLYWDSNNLKNPKQGCSKSESIGTQLFEWIEETLINVVKPNGASALIVGHRYPGDISTDSEQTKSCFTRYVTLVNDYKDVLRGHFFGGQEYIDRFFLVAATSNPNEKVGVINIAPAIEPKYNPAIRQYSYKYNGGGFLLTDYAQYYADLEESNTARRLNLIEEYSPLSTLGFADLSVTEWAKFNKKLDIDEQMDTLFERFKFVSSGLKASEVNEHFPYVACIGGILFFIAWIIMVYKCCRWPNVTYAQELQYAQFIKEQENNWAR